MSFQDRALVGCCRDFQVGRVSETKVRDLLKCENIDVSSIEEYLDEKYTSDVRLAAARVIMNKGNRDKVIEVTLKETNKENLFGFLRILSKDEFDITKLLGLSMSEDTMIRDELLEMFRRSGQMEYMFPLVFDSDDMLVKRVKRYINEER